jgi:hypothetical protein
MFNQPKTHADLSPSACHRWWNCPGSVSLSKKFPKKTSPDAELGTAAHEVLERCLKSKTNPFDMIGMEINGYEVDEEMAEAVSFTIDLVAAELQKGGDLLVETKIEVTKDIFGTLDIAIVRHFDKIVVIDFKYGKGVVVKAEYNYQLTMYLIGLMKKYECDRAELVIVQPRAYQDDKVSRWECDLSYVEGFAAELPRHIELTKEENALTVAGDWCRFCSAKVDCPALRDNLCSALTPVEGREILFPDARSLSTETVTKILDYRERIEKWLEAVAVHAQSILENGGAVPGYQLAKKRANRRWKSEEEVMEKFADLGDKRFEIKVISPAKMEKIVGKDKLNGLTETPDNGHTIKKVGSK